MIDALIRNLQADIALLQIYIVQRQKAGFHDMERMLEALSIHMFRALSIGELVNKNQLRVNFPAIDLADDKKMIAVQVTSNASPAKINKTGLYAGTRQNFAPAISGVRKRVAYRTERYHQ